VVFASAQLQVQGLVQTELAVIGDGTQVCGDVQFAVQLLTAVDPAVLVPLQGHAAHVPVALVGDP